MVSFYFKDSSANTKEPSPCVQRILLPTQKNRPPVFPCVQKPSLIFFQPAKSVARAHTVYRGSCLLPLKQSLGKIKAGGDLFAAKAP
jgi:hypothetical protein